MTIYLISQQERLYFRGDYFPKNVCIILISIIYITLASAIYIYTSSNFASYKKSLIKIYNLKDISGSKMSCENFEEYIELNQNFEEKQLVRNGFLENIRRYRASLIEEGELENTKDWNELYFGFKVEKVTYMGKPVLYRSHKRRHALFDFMFHKEAKNRYDSYIKFHVINAWTKFLYKRY